MKDDRLFHLFFVLTACSVFFSAGPSSGSSSSYGYKSDLGSAIAQEFGLSELTLIHGESIKEEAFKIIEVGQINISVRHITAQDLSLTGLHDVLRESGVLLLDLDMSLLQDASELGLLEKINWFIPFTNQSLYGVQLRLDSNVYMIRELSSDEAWLYEVYAIKNGPPIKGIVGKWTETSGLAINVSL